MIKYVSFFISSIFLVACVNSGTQREVSAVNNINKHQASEGYSDRVQCVDNPSTQKRVCTMDKPAAFMVPIKVGDRPHIDMLCHRRCMDEELKRENFNIQDAANLCNMMCR